MDLIANLPIEPPLTLLRSPVEEVDNVAVESLEVSRAVLGVGQKVMVRVNLVNHGDASFRDMRVYLRVDGENQDASQITLDPRQKGQVVFTHKFTTAGSHVLEAYAEADALKTDNVMRHSISVWDQLELLLVSGDTNPKPLESETAFLQIALQPFTSATASISDLIRASVVTPDRIKPELVAGNRVIVLANVPRLSDAQVNLLGGFVEAGGGLLVFAFSSFVPILHFAWLMVFLLCAALVGDLVLLPAMLAGPFGRCFGQKPPQHDRPLDRDSELAFGSARRRGDAES